MKYSKLLDDIRMIVREEIQAVINDTPAPVVNEVKVKKPITRMVPESNGPRSIKSILSEMQLNKSTIDGGYDTISFDANDVLQMPTMNINPEVNPNDPTAKFANKNYSAILKLADEKANNNRPV